MNLDAAQFPLICGLLWRHFLVTQGQTGWSWWAHGVCHAWVSPLYLHSVCFSLGASEMNAIIQWMQSPFTSANILLVLSIKCLTETSQKPCKAGIILNLVKVFKILQLQIAWLGFRAKTISLQGLWTFYWSTKPPRWRTWWENEYRSIIIFLKHCTVTFPKESVFSEIGRKDRDRDRQPV